MRQLPEELRLVVGGRLALEERLGQVAEQVLTVPLTREGGEIGDEQQIDGVSQISRVRLEAAGCGYPCACSLRGVVGVGHAMFLCGIGPEAYR